MRQILGGQHRVTATFRCADAAATLHVRKATRAEPPQRAIYDALGVRRSRCGTIAPLLSSRLRPEDPPRDPAGFYHGLLAPPTGHVDPVPGLG